MSANPAVSVIIPTYNRAQIVLNALQSVAGQSFQDMEIIVVDDGSIDNTRETVLSLQNQKMRYFHQENQGLPVAWNTGVERSRGRYLTFLDSDDHWFANKLKNQVDFLEKMKEQFSGCVTGYFLHTINGKNRSIIPAQAQTGLREIMRKNILHLGTTFMCTRNVFNEIGYFDKNLRRGQDSDWLIRYRQKFEIGVVPEILAVFNQHLDRSGESLENSSLYFLEKHKTALLEQGTVFYLRKAASIYRDLAYQFSRERNPAKALEYSRRAIMTYPLPSPWLWLILMDVNFGIKLKRRYDSIRYPGVFK